MTDKEIIISLLKKVNKFEDENKDETTNYICTKEIVSLDYNYIEFEFNEKDELIGIY